MRQLWLRTIGLCALVLMVTACTDSPTAPPGVIEGANVSTSYEDQTVQGCVIDGYCVLPPISGGGCDEYLELDWDCDDSDGDCMTAQSDEDSAHVGLAGCPTPTKPGGGYTEPPSNPEPADTCNTGDRIIDDPAVQAGFRDLWNKSGASQPQSLRLEHAAWIVRNADGTHRLAPFSYTVQTACEVNGNMNAPSGAVGWAHVHPFAAGEEMRVCPPVQREVSPGVFTVVRGPDGQPLYQRYANRPSEPDRNFMLAVNALRSAFTQDKLAGYMIDNETIVAYASNDNKDWPYGRCGY